MADCAQRGYWRSQGNPSLGSNHLPGVRSHYSGPSKGNDAGLIKLQLHFINIVSIKNVIRPNFKWKFDSKHSKLEQKMFFFVFFNLFMHLYFPGKNRWQIQKRNQSSNVGKSWSGKKCFVTSHHQEPSSGFILKNIIILNILKRIDHTNENGQVT